MWLEDCVVIRDNLPQVVLVSIALIGQWTSLLESSTLYFEHRWPGNRVIECHVQEKQQSLRANLKEALQPAAEVDVHVGFVRRVIWSRGQQLKGFNSITQAAR